MTPGGRVAAAIEVLDRILGGEPAEKALTTWARGNRFAGSGDRAAIRDHVFDALRCRRSFAALGGAMTGRGLMIGALRAAGEDPGLVFTGEGHAPMRLDDVEAAPPVSLADLPDAVRLDVPDWLEPRLRASLGGDFAAVMEALRHRAPVFLRVNMRKADHETAERALREDGILSAPHPLSPTARVVTENARRVKSSRAYLGGLVELQDAASQAVVDSLFPIPPAARVLDFCAGGGGKSLALAALSDAAIVAHDADPGRMRDLPVRAARAGVEVKIRDAAGLADEALFDLVFADAPCSGSGAWRRQPEAKWRLTAEGLDGLVELQANVLDAAAAHVVRGGRLAYATCSLLAEENEGAVAAFLKRHPEWSLASSRRLTPLDGADGFYVAQFKRAYDE